MWPFRNHHPLQGLEIKGTHYNRLGELVVDDQNELKEELLRRADEFDTLQRITGIMPDSVLTAKILERIVDDVRQELNKTEEFV